VDQEILERAKEQADLCRIFNNPARVLILWALVEREMSVSEIAATVEISLQNTSQHLRLMKDRDVLTCRREGQTIFYRIADFRVLDRMGYVFFNRNL
jgi:DNA-binding transcriptional ArsR family regulator